MRKWTIVLFLSICSLGVALEALSFFWLFGFPPFYRTAPMTVRELGNSLESWVGKLVSVNGKIAVHIISIPEDVPPYNCLLEDPDAKSLVGVGVDWSKSGSVDSLDGKNVTVVGVVTKGYTHACCGWIPTLVYYVDAEAITPIDNT